MQLHDKFKDKVACVSMSLDYQGDEEDKDDIQQEVLELLTEKKITVTNIIQADADKVDVPEKVGNLAIPITLVYDQSGELVKKFHNGEEEYGDKGFTYEDHIIPYVERLLEKK